MRTEISCGFENKTVTLRKSSFKDRLGIMVETNDRRLPVGIQSFEKIREQGYLYVDNLFETCWQNMKYLLEREVCLRI